MSRVTHSTQRPGRRVTKPSWAVMPCAQQKQNQIHVTQSQLQLHLVGVHQVQLQLHFMSLQHLPNIAGSVSISMNVAHSFFKNTQWIVLYAFPVLRLSLSPLRLSLSPVSPITVPTLICVDIGISAGNDRCGQATRRTAAFAPCVLLPLLPLRLPLTHSVVDMTHEGVAERNMLQMGAAIDVMILRTHGGVLESVRNLGLVGGAASYVIQLNAGHTPRHLNVKGAAKHHGFGKPEIFRLLLVLS